MRNNHQEIKELIELKPLYATLSKRKDDPLLGEQVQTVSSATKLTPEQLLEDLPEIILENLSTLHILELFNHQLMVFNIARFMNKAFFESPCGSGKTVIMALLAVQKVLSGDCNKVVVRNFDASTLELDYS